MSWSHKYTIIYKPSSKFNFSQSVAIFSFVDTLIKKPIWKSINSVGCCDNSSSLSTEPSVKFVYKNQNVKTKLQDIYKKGGSIIIYDSYKTDNLDEIKTAFDAFQKDVGCPMLVFFSTRCNRFCKPLTNIWKLIDIFYKNHNKVNKTMSLVIGHNAGRVSRKGFKLDNSCVDRAFANNSGLKFIIPEAFFEISSKFVFWEWDPLILTEEDKQLLIETKYTPVIIQDELEKLPTVGQCTIIITGVTSCGKSTLAAKIKRKWDCDYNNGVIERISENSNDIDEILKQTNTQLKNKKSVIIDMVCENINITQVVRVSMENKTVVLIVEIKTTKQLAQLLDFMKVQMSNNTDVMLKTLYTWQSYYKQYKCPRYDEIPCVRYVGFPLVIKVCDEFWYKYSF